MVVVVVAILPNACPDAPAWTSTTGDRPRAQSLSIATIADQRHLGPAANYDEMLQKLNKPDMVYGEVRQTEFHLGDIPGTEKLEKFVEDVK